MTFNKPKLSNFSHIYFVENQKKIEIYRFYLNMFGFILILCLMYFLWKRCEEKKRSI